MTWQGQPRGTDGRYAEKPEVGMSRRLTEALREALGHDGTDTGEPSTTDLFARLDAQMTTAPVETVPVDLRDVTSLAGAAVALDVSTTVEAAEHLVTLGKAAPAHLLYDANVLLATQRKEADWDPRLHPRDRNGRFIEIGAILNLLGSVGGGRGTVVGNGPNNHVTVRKDDGTEVDVPANQTYSDASVTERIGKPGQFGTPGEPATFADTPAVGGPDRPRQRQDTPDTPDRVLPADLPNDKDELFRALQSNRSVGRNNDRMALNATASAIGATGDGREFGRNLAQRAGDQETNDRIAATMDRLDKVADELEADGNTVTTADGTPLAAYLRDYAAGFREIHQARIGVTDEVAAEQATPDGPNPDMPGQEELVAANVEPAPIQTVQDAFRSYNVNADHFDYQQDEGQGLPEGYSLYRVNMGSGRRTWLLLDRNGDMVRTTNTRKAAIDEAEMLDRLRPPEAATTADTLDARPTIQEVGDGQGSTQGTNNGSPADRSAEGGSGAGTGSDTGGTGLPAGEQPAVEQIAEREVTLDDAARQRIVDEQSDTQRVFKVPSDTAGGQRFHDAVAQAKQGKYGAAVTLYDTDDYAGMDLYLAEGGKAGFALRDGEIMSAFNDDPNFKGALNTLMPAAIAEGGNRLDAFNTILPDLYAKYGFAPVARIPFDDEYAPDGWDYDTFGAWNGGRPDVYFMAHGAERPTEIPVAADYDAGVQAAKDAAAAGPSTESGDLNSPNVAPQYDFNTEGEYNRAREDAKAVHTDMADEDLIAAFDAAEAEASTFPSGPQSPEINYTRTLNMAEGDGLFQLLQDRGLYAMNPRTGMVEETSKGKAARRGPNATESPVDALQIGDVFTLPTDDPFDRGVGPYTVAGRVFDGGNEGSLVVPVEGPTGSRMRLILDASTPVQLGAGEPLVSANVAPDSGTPDTLGETEMSRSAARGAQVLNEPDAADPGTDLSSLRDRRMALRQAAAAAEAGDYERSDAILARLPDRAPTGDVTPEVGAATDASAANRGAAVVTDGGAPERPQVDALDPQLDVSQLRGRREALRQAATAAGKGDYDRADAIIGRLAGTDRPPSPAVEALSTIPVQGSPEGTGTVDDPIDVGDDVDLALQLLGEGKHVRLNQPDEVATLLDKVREVIADAKAKGEDAPTYDLCMVSVPGTNLFCAENQGIKRINMPQLSGIPLPGTPADAMDKNSYGGVDLAEDFVAALQEVGVSVTDETRPASHLRASQMELDGAKVAGIANAMAEADGPDELNDAPIFVTRDGYVIDGHHRWAAKVGIDTGDGELGDVPMNIRVVDMDIGAALDFANTFAARMGIPQADVTDNPVADAAPKPTFRRARTTRESYVVEVDGQSVGSVEPSRDAAGNQAGWQALNPTTRGPVGQPQPSREAAAALLTAPEPTAASEKPDVIEYAGERLAKGKDSLYDHLIPDGQGGFTLTPERKALHDEIITNMLAGVPESENPTLFMLGGGPAAGKSTMLGAEALVGVPNDEGLLDGQPAAVVVNPDNVKQVLPEYSSMIDGGRAKDAAGFVHEESSIIAKKLQSEAESIRRDVVLDGTGDSKLDKLLRKIAKARAAGYTVKGYYATVPTDVAWERADARAQQTGRHVHEEVLRGTHAAVSRVLPEAAPVFDEVTLFDTMDGARPIATATRDGDIEVLDEAAYAEFLDKGFEDSDEPVDALVSRLESTTSPALRAALQRQIDALSGGTP